MSGLTFTPMAGLIDNVKSLFRARVGKYNADQVPLYAGITTGTKAGVNITEQSSLAVSTVYACVYKIATSLAATPIEILRKENNRVEKDFQNPAYNVIGHFPNAEQTAFSFWEYVLSESLMYGKGYAIIERNNQGRVESLTPVYYYDVETKKVNGETYFKVRNYGAVSSENMLCVSNMVGLSPLRLQRDNIGLAKAAQDYGSDFFANGGQMVGILSTEQPLKSQQVEQVQKQWNNSQQTAGTKLLPFGFKYQPITVPPETMSFIQTRQLQAEEIARAYQVPAPLVGLGQATYDNLEQQNLLYKQGCLLPWARRIEQEIDRKLIPVFERPEVYSKFRLGDMYRTDLKAQGEFYQTMLQSGVLSINEVREQLELNAVNDGGDIHTVSVNQLSLDRLESYSDRLTESKNVE